MRFSYVNTTVYLCTVNAYSYNTITRVATRGYTYIFFLIPYPTKYSTYEFITHKGQRASIFRFGGNTEDLSRAAYELDNIHLAQISLQLQGLIFVIVTVLCSWYIERLYVMYLINFTILYNWSSVCTV